MWPLRLPSSAALVLASVTCRLLVPLEATIAAGPAVNPLQGAVDDGWYSEEELSLLQAELVLKSAASRSAGRVALPEERRHASCASFAACEAELPGLVLTFQSQPGKERDGRLSWPLLGANGAATELKQSAWPAEAAAPWKVACYMLNAFVAVAVLDLLCRWHRKGQSAVPDTCEPEPCAGTDFNALLEGVLVGDAERSEALIRAAPSIAGADMWGCTLLHAAANRGAVPVAKALLQSGAAVDALDAWDETPLHFAARAGHGEVCDLLLAAGASIDARNAQDWTPLVVAADAGQQAVCERLLSRGAGVAGLSEEELPALLAGLIAKQVVQVDNAAFEPLWELPECNPFEDKEDFWLSE